MANNNYLLFVIMLHDGPSKFGHNQRAENDVISRDMQSDSLLETQSHNLRVGLYVTKSI